MNDNDFYQNNWDEFVHKKIFDQTTQQNSAAASNAHSLASLADSEALSAGLFAKQNSAAASNAYSLASLADSHALSAASLASNAVDVAENAKSTAIAAHSLANSAGALASLADSHALSVVSSASDAISIANSAASVASQANSTANNNTALINKNTQAILTNKNNINDLNNKQDSTANDLTSLASLASQADSIANNANTTANAANSKATSNTTAITNLTNNVNGWQTSANNLMHANSAVASNAQHIANSTASVASQANSTANSAANVASQANSTANNNAALITKNTQAILTNKNSLNDLMNTTGYSNPVDFNNFNKVANYLANFWGAKSWANAPKNLPTAGWGTILVRVFNGYGVLQQWIIANDTMQAWNRYQNPNSRAWTMWHYYDFNNNVNIQNFNDNRLLNGATGTISAQLTGNVVTLNLQAQHETSNAVIYQLPAALRPKTNTQSAAVEFNNSTIYINYATISTNGNLQIEQRKYDNTLLENINVNTIFTYNLQ